MEVDDVVGGVIEDIVITVTAVLAVQNLRVLSSMTKVALRCTSLPSSAFKDQAWLAAKVMTSAAVLGRAGDTSLQQHIKPTIQGVGKSCRVRALDPEVSPSADFCFQVDSLRKGLSSDRRPVLDLLAVEGWRALLGLLDGQVKAKPLQAFGP